MDPVGSRPTDASSSPAPASAAEIAAFVGLWNYVGGTSTTDCSGNVMLEPATGSLELQAGADAPVQHIEDCVFRLDVAGRTARYRTSPASAQDIGGYTIVPTSGTIQLDGQSVIVKNNFLVVSQVAAGPVNCNLRVDANAVRIFQGVPLR